MRPRGPVRAPSSPGVAVAAVLFLISGCGGSSTSVEGTAGVPVDGAAAPAAGVRVEDAWVTAPPPGTRVLAVYMQIHNDADQEDWLLRAESSVVNECELHETIPEGETLRMVAREEGKPVPAHDRLTLEPGGVHLMLFGVQTEVKPGGTIPLTLHFRNAGSVEVSVLVREM